MSDKWRKWRKRLRDYSLYIAISCATVGGLVFLMIVTPLDEMQRVTDLYGSAFLTFFLFGFFLEANRKNLKRRWFWALFTVLFVIHCLVLRYYVLFSSSGKRWTNFCFIAGGTLLVITKELQTRSLRRKTPIDAP